MLQDQVLKKPFQLGHAQLLLQSDRAICDQILAHQKLKSMLRRSLAFVHSGTHRQKAMRSLAEACLKIDGHAAPLTCNAQTADIDIQQQHGDALCCAETAVLANQLNSEKFTLISIHPGWVSTGTLALTSSCDVYVNAACSVLQHAHWKKT